MNSSLSHNITMKTEDLYSEDNKALGTTVEISFSLKAF